jgi:hypothetical protein
MLLETLETIGGVSKRRIGFSAIQIIKKTEGSLTAKQNALGNYKVIYCKSYLNDSEKLESWNALLDYNDNLKLFQGNTPYAHPMQQSIPDIQFYRLPKIGGFDPFDIVFGENGSNLDYKKCFDILMKKPRLKEYPLERLPIINELIIMINNVDASKYEKTIRYLLHGKAEKFDDLDTPLMLRPHGGDDILSKVAQNAVEQLGEKWAWLPDELSNNIALNNEQFNRLNLRQFNERTVEERLQRAVKKAGVGWITAMNLTPPDTYRILNIFQHTNDIWRSLPIHETTDRELVTLCEYNKKYFFESIQSFQTPDNLPQNIIVIRRTNHDSLDALYADTLNLKPWNAKNCLKTICNERERHHFADCILNLIQEIGSVDDADLSATLKNTAWLPTNDGPRSPEKIIHLPGIQIATIVERTEYFGKESIKDEIVKHDGFSLVEKELFPDKNESLWRLGQCLQNNEKYYQDFRCPLKFI